MSVSRLSRGSGGDSGGTIWFYDDCEPKAQLIVGNYEIPIINKGIETQIRTDGPMDINFLTDVYIPAEWDGVNVVERIQAFGSDLQSWEPVDVQYQDDSGEYVTVHRGFPISFGPGATGTLERRLQIGDAGMLLKGMPYSKSFDYDSDLYDVVNDVINTFADEQSIFSDVDIRHLKDGVEKTLWSYTVDGALEKAVWLVDPRSTAKTFQSNEHTLQDAISWVTSNLSGELYFSPVADDNDVLSLIYDEDRSTEFVADDLESTSDPQPTILNNNALYEIQPINTYKVVGSPRRGLGERFEALVQADVKGDQEYPVAKAVHDNLREQSKMELKPPIDDKDARSEDEVATIAQGKLIEQIEGGGMGEIQTHIFPYILPHDTISAPPSCGSNLDMTVDPLTYSVNSVTHSVGYDKESENMVRKTFLRANTKVTEDDITVTTSIEHL